MPPFRAVRRTFPARRIRWQRRARQLAVIGLLLGLLWLASEAGLIGESRLTATGSGARAIDGDSFVMTTADGAVTVRLAGIDAPEYRQTCTRQDGQSWPCGAAARDALVTILAGTALSCEVLAEDRYARRVSRCGTTSVPDAGAAIVAQGLALANGRGDFPPYWREQADARQNRRGMWQGDFDDPQDWRRAHPRQ